MDAQLAKEILSILADGINPSTGEVLPDSDSCNQIDVVRALHAAIAALGNTAKPVRARPVNAGKPWTKEDEATLCRMFDEGYTNKEISNYFKRSPGAIAARLVRLGKISQRDEFRI